MSKTTFISALAAAQSEMSNAPFDKVNPHFKSKYASLTSVRDAVVPCLTKHGIAAIQTPVQTESGQWIMRTTFKGEDGEVSGDTPILADKANAQAFGSALTYAKRYGLAALACIASDEDDDGNEATANPPKSISKEQYDKLMQRCAELKVDMPKFCARLGVGDLKSLPAEHCAHAHALLTQKEQASKALTTEETAALTDAIQGGNDGIDH